MTFVLCAALLSTLGAEEEIELSAPPMVTAEADIPIIRESFPRFAMVFDVGVPDGAGASLSFRPWAFLRIHAGAVSNGVSPGVRGGLTLAPSRWALSPTLTLEGGHIFEGNANKLVGFVSQNPGFHTPALDHLGYDFANIQFGFDLGPPDRWAFYARVGVSYLRASTALQSDVRTAVQNATAGLVNVDVTEVWMPSLKLGLTLYVL